MGNEFSGLPMADLIGAPLNAACDAQIRLAKATAEFINTVGFTPGEDGKLTPRQVDFAFYRPSTELEADDQGNKIAKVEKVAISVPFLALVNVPALAIKSVDIVFDMEVKTSETTKETDSKQLDVGANIKFGFGPVSGSVDVKASVASHKEHTRSTDKSAKYHVEVRARDDGMPEGLSRVLDMLQSAIGPVAVSKPISADAANLTQNHAALPSG